MKNSKKLVVITAFMLILVNTMRSQKIQYFYFAPETTMVHNFSDKAKIFERTDSEGAKYTELPGYRYILIKGDNYQKFASMAAPNMLKTYDRLNSNTQLKKEIDNLMSLSDGIVDINVLLVDDRTGLSSTKLFCTGKDNTDNQLFVWPCADNRKKSNGTRYFGQVFLGERAALIDVGKPGGFINWEGTVIHEFSHTQFLPDPQYRRNKWKNVGISYGGDKGHWSSELMGDEQMALDEGMGSFFGLTHNPPTANRLIEFLNRKEHRFLLGSRSFLSGIPEMWDSPHKIWYSGSVDGLPNWITLVRRPSEGDYQLREYRWLDVPATYVMNNEKMSEAYFYLMHQYAFADEKKAYKRIFLAAKEMAKPNVHNRYIAFAANHIAKNMELYASSVPGRDDAARGTLVSSMFAYGILDLLTHFGMTEEEFKNKLRKNQSGSSLPIAYLKYWSQRNKLKKLVCPYLGGNDCQNGTGDINILMAVTAMRDFLQNPELILMEPF
nr:hypothetical protein [Allomuricauda sp.]